MMRLTMLPQRAWILLVVAAAGYCAFLAIVYLRQDKLLYFPDKYSLDSATARARMVGFRIWPENTPHYHGFVQADAARITKGVILLCHGNAGAALDRSFYAKDLAHLGYRLILFEYPGYGARSGEPREAAFVSAAVAAARSALEEFGGPLYLFGESLGSGVASAVAGSGQVPVAGVVLITPWDTLPDMAQSMYWYLPARWMTKDKYDNIRNLGKYRGSVAVVVAEGDEIIPPERGRRVFERFSSRKKFWSLARVGHNNWPTAANSTWWREVMRFIAAEEAPGDIPPGKNGTD
jgi:pimeloyl-ACP methyl ester carboxylesterase